MIPPDGDGFLLPGPDNEAAATSRGPSNETLQSSAQELAEIERRRIARMLGMWARDVLRAAHSYYQAAVRAGWTDRAIDYGEDWSPTEADLRVEIEQVWVRGYHLIMAATQMEQWLGVYRGLVPERSAGQEDGSEEHNHVQLLKALRNTIEHLTEAQIGRYMANQHPESTRRHESITQLPGEELFLGFAAGFEDTLFGLVSVTALVGRAQAYAYVDFDDVQAESRPLAALSDCWPGKYTSAVASLLVRSPSLVGALVFEADVGVPSGVAVGAVAFVDEANGFRLYLNS